MNDAEIIGKLILAVGGISAVATPLLKLNSSIVRLNVILDNMQKNDDKRDEKLEEHSKKIEILGKAVDRHELRLNQIDDCEYKERK